MNGWWFETDAGQISAFAETDTPTAAHRAAAAHNEDQVASAAFWGTSQEYRRACSWALKRQREQPVTHQYRW